MPLSFIVEAGVAGEVCTPFVGCPILLVVVVVLKLRIWLGEMESLQESKQLEIVRRGCRVARLWKEVVWVVAVLGKVVGLGLL